MATGLVRSICTTPEHAGLQAGWMGLGRLGVQVPGASKAVSTAKTPVTLRVGENGIVSFNDSPVDSRDDREMPKLLAKLKALVEASSDQSVIIRPNDKAPYQRVIDVLNACGAARVKNLTFGG